MSWFKTTNFTSLAKSALKEAQKTIDKALDINNDDSLNCDSSSKLLTDGLKLPVKSTLTHSGLDLSKTSKHNLVLIEAKEPEESANNDWDWSWDEKSYAAGENISQSAHEDKCIGLVDTSQHTEKGAENLDEPQNEALASNTLLEVSSQEDTIKVASDSTLITPDVLNHENPVSANETLVHVDLDTDGYEPFNTAEKSDSDINMGSRIVECDTNLLHIESVDPLLPFDTVGKVEANVNTLKEEFSICVTAENHSLDTTQPPIPLPTQEEPLESVIDLCHKYDGDMEKEMLLQNCGNIEQITPEESIELLSHSNENSIRTQSSANDDIQEMSSSDSIELLSFSRTPSSIEILYDASSPEELIKSEKELFLPERITSQTGTRDNAINKIVLEMCNEESKKIIEAYDIYGEQELSYDESLHSSASAESSHTLIGSYDTEVKKIIDEDADDDNNRVISLPIQDSSAIARCINSSVSRAEDLITLDGETKSMSNSLASWFQNNFPENLEKPNEICITPDRVLSGHTSADEIEVETTESTATSSDIEIISSPNSENDHNRLSPGKMKSWNTKCNKFLLGDRAESPSSDGSAQGKGFYSVKGHRRKSSEASSESSGENLSSEVDRLNKKTLELQGLLEIREGKILDLSRSNVELNTKNEILQVQVSDNAKEIKSLQENLKDAIVSHQRIKDNYEKLLKDQQTSSSVFDLKAKYDEQQCVMHELRTEGEKLSKQQLQQSNHIKKLKNKERELETQCASLKTQLEDKSKELTSMKEQLKIKEDCERKLNVELKQVNIKASKGASEINQLKQELIEREGKMETLKSSLDSAYKDIAELHHKLAMTESKAVEMTLSAEMATRQELQHQLEEERSTNRKNMTELQGQLLNLHTTIGSLQQQSSQVENNLKIEIAILQKQLEDSESKNSELNLDISSNTKPLLRQIESLQSCLSSVQKKGEENERHLISQIDDLQIKLSAVKEKEKLRVEESKCESERISEYMREIANKESEISDLKANLMKQEQLLRQLESDKTKERELIEESKARIYSELLALKNYNENLISQYESEKELLKAEKEKNIALTEIIQERKKKLELNTSSETDSRTPRDSPTSLSKFSMAGSLPDSCTSNTWPDEVIDNNFRFYPYASTTSVVESLQAQVKQKEGEVSLWQNEVTRLERVKESLAHEIASLNGKNMFMVEEIEELKKNQIQKIDLEQKYNTLLQLYGEKIEENEELKLDLIDIKDMYKSQIDELVQKVK